MATPSQPPSELAPGHVLAGKYRIDRTLGSGGMCLVYEAEHIHLRQAIALKLLKPELAKDSTAVARFAQEAQAAAKLRSPNVARVYDVDTLPDGQPYITMELLVGHDLGTELERRYALPVDLAVDYVRQAANGILEAHTLGIVHRDLKPENLFLTDLGEMTERRLLKILDFGIAKNVHDGERKLTAPDAVFGTVDYMSPEQIRSASSVDHRTDIWSLGVILYELLTGRTPYAGDARSIIAQIVSDPIVPPTRYVPSLPPPLVAIIMRALAKDADQRFQSADELRRALTPFCDTIEPINAVLARLPPASVPRRSPHGARPTGDPGRAGTNLAFETGSSRSMWARHAFAAPLIGAVIVTAVGVTLWKRNVLHPMTPQQQTPASPPMVYQTSQTSQTPPLLPPPAATTAIPVPAALPAGGPQILGVSTPPDATPPAAPVATAPPHPTKRTRPAPRASGPREPPPAPPTSEPTHEPAPTASALPKHI